MFDVGSWGELLIIVISVLILIRPNDIPGFASSFIKLLKKFQDYINEIGLGLNNLHHRIGLEDFKKKTKTNFLNEIEDNLNKLKIREQKTKKITMLKNNNKYSSSNKYQVIQPHIKELRRRIILCLFIFFIYFLILYPFSTYMFNFLVRPLYVIFQDQNSRRLIYTGLSEAFMVHIKISLLGSVALSLPYIFYHIWAFIVPGLYRALYSYKMGRS